MWRGHLYFIQLFVFMGHASYLVAYALKKILTFHVFKVKLSMLLHFYPFLIIKNYYYGALC